MLIACYYHYGLMGVKKVITIYYWLHAKSSNHLRCLITISFSNKDFDPSKIAYSILIERLSGL